jgi:hypothetical protein
MSPTLLSLGYSIDNEFSFGEISDRLNEMITGKRYNPFLQSK